MPPKFQNNQMTISHRETFNETCNNIFPSKETKEKLTLGPRVLKKSIIIMSIKCWIIFLTMKSKKRRSLGGRSHFDAKKMGFTKNGYMMKVLKTQGSKQILIEMDKGRSRSLEKCFLWEEMLRWRTKIKGKKKVNSANGGREVDGRWSKKGKEKRQRSGGPKFWPPHLKLSQKLS